MMRNILELLRNDFINVRPPNEWSDHSIIWCGIKTNVTFIELDDEFENVYKLNYLVSG